MVHTVVDTNAMNSVVMSGCTRRLLARPYIALDLSCLA